MKTTATEFRSNLYKYLDRVLTSGEIIEIERKGRIIQITAQKQASKLSRIKQRKTLIGSTEEIIHTDWSEYWNPSQGFSNFP